MELFTPLWKSKSEYKRRKWINEKANLKNPKHIKILEDISKNDKFFDLRQLAFEKLGRNESQDAISDIAKNAYRFETRFEATLKLQDENLKTDNLIKLFNSVEQSYSEKIAILLKELYKKDELNQENKAKILELKGKAIIHHDDFSGNSCYPGHSDWPGTYFEV